MWAKGIQLNAKRGGVNIVPFLPSGTPTSGMPPTHLVVLTSLAWSALKRQPKTLRRIYLYFLIKKKKNHPIFKNHTTSELEKKEAGEEAITSRRDKHFD